MGNAKSRLTLIQLNMNRFARDVRGTIIFAFAFVFPVMLLGVGAAIDYGQLYSKRTTLQGAADASALTAAHGLRLANADKSEVEAVAKAAAMANLAEMPGTIGFSVQVSANPLSVTVELSQTPGLYFMDRLTGDKETVIKARATAKVAGKVPICMLILEPSKQGALTVNKKARITGNDCAVYSNSVSSSGIITKDSALLESGLTCSAGGAIGDPSTYKPGPLTDCPPFDDPLASRSPPHIGACTETDLVIDSGMRTLNPGTYCGGLTIKDADVTLNPGIYVIKDGVLWVGGSARVTGENVGFYITGAKANFNMLPNTSIQLSAPKGGPMAGLLFFEDRNNPLGRRNVIRSNDARSFIGTIYLSRGAFVVDASKPLFEKSAYTVIVARFMDMFSGPNLVLNSNYGDTDVPIPEELEAASSPGDQIVLSK